MKTKPSQNGRRRRVFIADANGLVRRCLANLVNHEEDLLVSGQAATGRETLKALKKGRPDVIVSDLDLPDMSAWELLPALQKKRPPVPLLVISLREGLINAPRVLRAGAQGYLMKQDSAEHIVSALRRLLKGETIGTGNKGVK